MRDSHDDSAAGRPAHSADAACAETIGANPLKDTLARAEQATTALRANYTQWASVDVEHARTLLAAARNAPSGRLQLDQVYAAMHNIKGQGSSFGYPLVTRIGHSMCRLIAPGRVLDDAEFKVAQAHLDALKLVLDKKIAGPGGPTGEALAARLEAMTTAADR